MPLTKEERDFLDAFAYEATHEPFGGPATDELRRRHIYYADLHGLLTRYHREFLAERTMPFGKPNPTPPPSPWANREQVELRGTALMEECDHRQSKPPMPTGALVNVSPPEIPSPDH